MMGVQLIPAVNLPSELGCTFPPPPFLLVSYILVFPFVSEQAACCQLAAADGHTEPAGRHKGSSVLPGKADPSVGND